MLTLDRTQQNHLHLSDNAEYLLAERYLDKAKGETPEQLFRRVARTLAKAEMKTGSQETARYWEERFYSAMSRAEFLPGSPVLLNAGRNSGQISSCHCIPVPLQSKYCLVPPETATNVQIKGSGTAFNLSRVRSQKDEGLTGSRPAIIQILHSYSKALASVLQGGIRTGCNTAVLSVHHPHIREFIEAKTDPGVLNNFYLTVSLSDSFMESLSRNVKYPLIDPASGEQIEFIPAEDVFNAIVNASWKNGDPGVIFENTINRSNPAPWLGQVETISGCGEQLLAENECCFLGSVNLAKMIHSSHQGRTEIDWGKLKNTIMTAVRLLDNAIEANTYESAQIEQVTKFGRKIGLGIMGLGDLFYLLKTPYSSQQAADITGHILKFIKTQGYAYSAYLAKEKGPCPAILDVGRKPAIRNSSITTVAPTGTISIIAGCSAGIEPVFRLVYLRQLANGKNLLEINPYFLQAVLSEKLDVPSTFKQLIMGKPLQQIAIIPEHIKQVFVTAQDISPEWHLSVQQAAQKHVDNAVSKTVNLNKNASKEEIRQIYLKAYSSGLKGITVYRDMSRKNQPLTCTEEGVSLLEVWLEDNGFCCNQ